MPETIADHVFTKQLPILRRTGRARPTPAVGAPTLVWHVAFWPKRDRDPHAIAMVTPFQDDGPDNPVRPPKVLADDKVREEYDGKRSVINDDFGKLLKRLQLHGRPGPKGQIPEEVFVFEPPVDWEETSHGGRLFNVFQKETLGFTLWWEEASEKPIGERPNRMPVESDIRVRVEAELRADFSTITFLIDVGSPWNREPVYKSADGTSNRREKILAAIESVRTICETRVDDESVANHDILPELIGLPPLNAKHLLTVADYMFEGVWGEFCKSFGFDIEDISGTTDEIFSNSRGLVMSSLRVEPRINCKGEKKYEEMAPSETANRATTPFARFDFSQGQGYGGAGYSGNQTEPNKVVKGYAPFLRRMVPEADYRDWIACGVFDGRALLLTTLGATSEFDQRDEGEVEFLISANSLPSTSKRAPSRPFRYLILTKYEPHRKQLGRIVDRVNTLNTFGLFALKDWSIVREAGTKLRIYGSQLDDLFRVWNKRITDIDEKHEEAMTKLTGNRVEREAVTRKLKAKRDELLALANQQTERLLISMNSSLDRLGVGAVGGLPFRVNRSRHYAGLYRDGIESLRIGQIDTWWSYGEFAKRGMDPAFIEIASVGDRLERLRARLLGAMQSIQTSSIANQTEATRDNTYQLEQIAERMEKLVGKAEAISTTVEKLKETADAGYKYFIGGRRTALITVTIVVTAYILIISYYLSLFYLLLFT